MQNAVPFHIPSALFPVEHRFLDLDGARIHYVDEGAGDRLLLLHGNPLLNCDAGGLSANGQVWAPEGGDQPYEVKLQADGIILEHVKKLRYAELDETTLIRFQDGQFRQSNVLELLVRIEKP